MPKSETWSIKYPFQWRNQPRQNLEKKVPKSDAQRAELAGRVAESEAWSVGRLFHWRNQL